MLQKCRTFFAERGILEVDCPALSRAAPVDRHIDVMSVLLPNGTTGYLHTSAEYGMKRLLSLNIGDIYQISHVFRAEELGPLHNPEFTMVEWYRLGICFDEMIEETLAFIRLFLGNLPAQKISYRNLWRAHLNLNYLTATPTFLLEQARLHAIDLPQDAVEWDKDTLLQMLLSLIIEPKLGQDHLLVLTHFPASQAALANTYHQEDGEHVAFRFEIYFKGIELANGYHELTDPIEQQQRFINTNQERRAAGKQELKIDERFLAALKAGLPDCCGVAVGFDRLMMLQLEQTSLKNVLTFAWDEA